MASTHSPKAFHIFGSGISFSISPTIHNSGFQHYGLPFTYDIRESPSIDDVADLISDEKLGGANTAKLIGAINTLVIKNTSDGRTVIGDNTDWSGLHTIIADYSKVAPQKPTVGLVIGAGGASRAALYAMHRAGIQHIYLVNRTQSVAEKVKEDFRPAFEITILPNLQELPRMPHVIIGTVPATVTTEDQFSGIFGSSGLCIEMAYKPRQTPLLTVAQKHPGWQTVTGLEVLLAQGYDQFGLWTGLEPPREKMVEAVAEHEREKARKEMAGLL
ncbi:unnamed protein product [Penicillium pancosmium]